MAGNKAATSPAPDTADREIVLSRVFDAPRELVWDALVDPQQVVQWWGPWGFTTTIHEMDLRPGGVWRHTMHGPDGTNYPNEIVFVEVAKHERIVYSQRGGRECGPAAHCQVIWSFEEEADKTKLTLRMVFDSPEERGRVNKDLGVVEGGRQTLERLAARFAEMPISAALKQFVGKDQHSGRTGPYHHAHLRCSARTRLECLDRPETSGAMVEPPRFYESCL